MPLELDDEKRLSDRARNGDRDALAALLREHGPRLYRAVLLPRLGSKASAEEALSMTYLRIVERFGDFTWQEVGVYPYFRVIAMRIAIDQLRARKREVLFEPDDLERELETPATDDPSAEWLELYDLRRARERVESLLARLHPRYAQAIRLRILEERPREEVAETLGVSTATFDVVLHRAMAALKKALAAEGPDQ